MTPIRSGELSRQAIERLSRPATEPLRPPPLADHEAIDRWRQTVHDAWLDGDPSATECGHTAVDLAGVRTLQAGLDSNDRGIVCYFHGGGYVLGSPEVSLPITARLARTVGVVSVDYRLAPGHPYPAAVEDGMAAYSGLRERFPTSPLVLAGDSAGANIALSVAIGLRDLGRLPIPSGLIFFSPHLGFATPPSEPAVEDPRSDVDEEASRWLSEAYRGDLAPEDPRVSPLLASLHDLPPTLIQVGGSDSALPQAERYAELAEAAGCSVVLDRWPRLWHGWHYHRGLPEADAALTDAADFALGCAAAANSATNS